MGIQIEGFELQMCADDHENGPRVEYEVLVEENQNQKASVETRSAPCRKEMGISLIPGLPNFRQSV